MRFEEMINQVKKVKWRQNTKLSRESKAEPAKPKADTKKIAEKLKNFEYRFKCLN